MAENEEITNNSLPKKEKRGRKPKPGSVKEYFTHETEWAIVQYNSPDLTIEEKNVIYEKYLYKAFKKLVYFTTKSYPLYFDKRCTVEDMEEELLIFAFNNLHMYNPDKLNKDGKKPKAFSYFSTICKHEAKHISERNYKLDKTSDDVIENLDILERDINISYRINEDLVEDQENNYLIKVFYRLCGLIRDKINTDNTLKEIDIKVGNALITILENFKYMNEPTSTKNTLYFINNRVVDMIMDYLGYKHKRIDIKKSIKIYKDLYFDLKGFYLEN